METDSGMDRLASCYFCGVAVEAPLEEYPVVPRDLRPSVEDQSTVVLCPECRRKLSTIVDRVVRVATDPDQTEDTDQRRLGETDATDDTEQAGTSVLDGFDHESPDLLEMSEGEQTTPDEDPTTASQGSSDDESGDPEDATGRGRNEIGAGWFENEVDERDQDGDDGAIASGEVAEPAGRTASEGDGNDGNTDADTETRAFSRSAYNRVVKLLQNRAFPVETDAIVTVAASAYDIERTESQAIIDALADRGVIERDGGQLRRSDASGE